MNSSEKYRKNAEGFQRQNLVREVQAPQPGRSFRPQQPPQPVVPEPAPDRGRPDEPSAPAAQAPADEVIPPLPSSAPIPPPIESEMAPATAVDPVGEAIPPPAPAVDMSLYIGVDEAEARIDAAYREGVKTGREQAEEDYGSAVRALVNACTQINTLQETIIKNSSGELQELAIAIADRILRLSVREQDRTIVATIEEALQQAIRSEEFTVFVNPEDHDIVVARSPDIVAGISGLENIVIKTDSSVERGGARMESDNCTIDATIASQFELIREEIINRRGSGNV